MKLLLGAAAAAFSIAVAPQAHADQTFYPSGSKGDGSFSGYWYDLNYYGVHADLPTASALGTVICTKMRDGMSESSAISLAAGANGVTLGEAKVAVWGAEWHFCPERY